MPKVIIVTSKSDLHADHVIRKLVDSGVPFARLNSDEMRQTLKVAFSLSEEKHFLWTKSGGEIA